MWKKKHDLKNSDEITQKITPITSQQLDHDIKPPQVANLLLSKTQLMDI